MDGQSVNKQNEVSVVPETDACAQPYAVVVEFLNTVVADVAMSCALRSEN
jgi:hypothetical protein